MVTNIVGNMIFSGIGFVAFVYGKKMQMYKTMTLGLVLMIFPYFVGSTLWMYVIGAALSTALFIFRD